MTKQNQYLCKYPLAPAALTQADTRGRLGALLTGSGRGCVGRWRASCRRHSRFHGCFVCSSNRRPPSPLRRGERWRSRRLLSVVSCLFFPITRFSLVKPSEVGLSGLRESLWVVSGGRSPATPNVWLDVQLTRGTFPPLIINDSPPKQPSLQQVKCVNNTQEHKRNEFNDSL